MNKPAQPDPHSPIDAEASAAPTKPAASKGSLFWSLLVGLLLTAALALFAMDRLGVRLPTTPSPQTSVPTVPAVPGPVTNTAAVVSTSAKPAVVFARQQDQIQTLIGHVQGLPSLAQPPNLTSPATPVQGPLAGSTLWSRLSDSLSELFVVRRLSPTAQPMLDEAGDRLARQELRLLLLSARMSLVIEQPRQARADLVAAQGLLPKFFRTEDSAVQAFAEQLTAVLTSLPGQP